MKTLNDLRCAHNGEFSCCEDQGKSGNPHAVDTEELRQEAKKWVKELNENCNHQFECDCRCSNSYHIREWIGHFFNLEEEKP